ncbi:MAG: AbrB/MazE/SpoVT family DNA-binding domain-containing protein [Bacillota bacterium]
MVTCISSGGTITLPEQIRNYLGLEPFDDLVFSVEDGVIVAAKVKEACKQYKAEE